MVLALLAAAVWSTRERWMPVLLGPPAEREARLAAQDEGATDLEREAEADAAPASQREGAVALGPQRQGVEGDPSAAEASPGKDAPGAAARATAAAGEPSTPAPAPGEGTLTAIESTRTGLRRFSAPESAGDGEPARGTSAIDPAEDGLRRAWEADPRDPEALARLLDLLVARQRPDEALEALVRCAEDGSDAALVTSWSLRLDPFREAEQALFSRALEGVLAVAEASLARDLWLNAAASFEQAQSLVDGLRWELGQSADDAAARIASGRGNLLRQRAAVDALAAAGAPLADDVIVGSRLAALRTARADERAIEAGRAHVIGSRHARLQTLLPLVLAEQASEVLEAAYSRAAARFDHDPVSRTDLLAVELVGDASTFEARRQTLDDPPSARLGAFLAPGGSRLVVLDPRESGGDLDRLWGLVSREATRRVLLDLAGPDRRLPPWLEWGLAVEAEGARLRADGSLELGRAPAHRWRELAASLAGAGRSPRQLEGVLVFDGRDADGVAWAFALVSWLAAGAPGFEGLGAGADPLERLLAAYAAGSALPPATALRQQALIRADGAVPTLRSIEQAWNAWLQERVARVSGDAAALGRSIEEAREHVAQRRYEQADAELDLLLAVAPTDTRVLELALDLLRKRGRTDRALLVARLLGSARATPSQAAPADERLGEALAIQRSVGEVVVALDTALRRDASALIERLLADGRPLACVRVLDRLSAAWPLDGGFSAARSRVLHDVLGIDELLVSRRLVGPTTLASLHGERELWETTGDGLRTRCADRPEPTTLRGLAELEPPWRVSVQLAFGDGERELPAGPGHYVGLLFGAPTPADHGEWGVLLAPSGRVSLASRGHLEWPGVPIGRGPRGECALEVRVEGQSLAVLADGRSLGELALGSRPAAGWLALHARGVDVSLSSLTLSRTREVDPAQVWYVRAGF